MQVRHEKKIRMKKRERERRTEYKGDFILAKNKRVK